MFLHKIWHFFISIVLINQLCFGQLEQEAIFTPFKADLPLIYDKPNQGQEVWLTIFVHGIMSIKPHVSCSNFVKLIQDDVQETIYARTVNLMRGNPHFYMNQAMQGFGLVHANPYQVVQGNASGAMAYVIDTFNNYLYNGRRKNYYYTFGWTGLLSATQRYLDAISFFEELEKLIQQFQAHGINPKIRIIGYSHGGNIAINLAAVRQRLYQSSPLAIDELVLIGTPIQSETDVLITDPMFKKIYNMFSDRDRVQRIDFFSHSGFLSNKTFKPRSCWKLPNKLIQVKIKVTRTRKIEAICPEQQALLKDFSISSVVTGRHRLLRDVSPGHAEIWFFSWTPMHYRKTFPLAPLSAIAYVDFIINSIEKCFDTISPSQPIIADIRPEQEVLLLRYKNQKKPICIYNLLPKQEMDIIHQRVWQYAPEQYTEQEYDKHIRQATEFIKNQVQEERYLKEELRKAQCSLCGISEHEV